MTCYKSSAPSPHHSHKAQFNMYRRRENLELTCVMSTAA